MEQCQFHYSKKNNYEPERSHTKLPQEREKHLAHEGIETVRMLEPQFENFRFNQAKPQHQIRVCAGQKSEQDIRQIFHAMKTRKFYSDGKIRYRAIKSEDPIKMFYYSSSDISKMLAVETRIVRAWSNEFGINPHRGNFKPHLRRYTRSMVAKLHVIYNLLMIHKYTIEGAHQILRQKKSMP